MPTLESKINSSWKTGCLLCQLDINILIMLSHEIRSRPGTKSVLLWALAAITHHNYPPLIFYSVSKLPWLSDSSVAGSYWWSEKWISTGINLTAAAGWHASHITWMIVAYSKSHSSLSHDRSRIHHADWKFQGIGGHRYISGDFQQNLPVWHLTQNFMPNASFIWEKNTKTYLWNSCNINEAHLMEVLTEMKDPLHLVKKHLFFFFMSPFLHVKIGLQEDYNSLSGQI